MEKPGKKFASIIKEWRTIKGLSQVDMAKSLEVPLRTFQTWEKNYTSSIENYLRICKVLSIDPSELLRQFDSISQFQWEKQPQLESDRVEIVPDFKTEIAKRALSGESSYSVFEWLQKKHPQEVGKVTNQRRFIENCLLDIYHTRPHFYTEKPFPRSLEKEKALADLFKIPQNQVIVSQSGYIQQKVLREIILSRYGAEWIIKWCQQKSGFRLGIAGGYVLAKILSAVPRGSVNNAILFPMNFTSTLVNLPISSSALISSFLYRSTGYGVMTDTISEEQVFSSMMLADAAFLGIGTFSEQGIYERMIRSKLGQLAITKIRKLKIIGDFNYHLLNQEGTQLDLPEIISDIGNYQHNPLIKSIGLQTLKEKADRGCYVVVAATGEHKAAIVKTVMQHRFANHLITDDTIADQILNQETSSSR